MRALNFYSSIYHGILVCRRKSCTIRLGDKTGKYNPGDLVWVTYGDRYGKRKKVFVAIIDSVCTKKLRELTPGDLRAENPDMKEPRDAADFLGRIYQRPVDLDDTVSVIYFSEVIE